MKLNEKDHEQENLKVVPFGAFLFFEVEKKQADEGIMRVFPSIEKSRTYEIILNYRAVPNTVRRLKPNEAEDPSIFPYLLSDCQVIYYGSFSNIRQPNHDELFCFGECRHDTLYLITDGRIETHNPRKRFINFAVQAANRFSRELNRVAYKTARKKLLEALYEFRHHNRRYSDCLENMCRQPSRFDGNW